jgi:hypothetical protein
MLILAKPVRANEYWILKQGDEKIGNIEATHNGFVVKIKDNTQQFRTLNMIRSRAGIDFEPVVKKKPTAVENHVHGYPAGCKAHNPMFEVRQHLPLFTKNKKSKSWHAAGWYCILLNKTWQVSQSPKLITLQRYKYRGPYMTKEDAANDAH